ILVHTTCNVTYRYKLVQQHREPVLGVACRRGDRMIRRREFITLLGSAAAAWPLAAQAQQPERVHRIGVLMGLAASDRDASGWISAFEQALQKSGWSEGRNIKIEYRWGTGDARIIRAYAAELIGLAPEVIVTRGSTALRTMQQETKSIPILSRVKSRPSCRWCNRPNSSWLLISRPPKRSPSLFRPACSRSPTRCSSRPSFCCTAYVRFWQILL